MNSLDIYGVKDVQYNKARKIDYFTSSALPLQPSLLELCVVSTDDRL